LAGREFAELSAGFGSPRRFSGDLSRRKCAHLDEYCRQLKSTQLVVDLKDSFAGGAAFELWEPFCPAHFIGSIVQLKLLPSMREGLHRTNEDSTFPDWSHVPQNRMSRIRQDEQASATINSAAIAAHYHSKLA
jgi:hypothetical protein